MSLTKKNTNARQLTLDILRHIDRQHTYTDIALDRSLTQNNLNPSDRSLCTQLVYGIVRHQRTLDTLIDQLGKKKAQQQPPDLRRILHIGLYQLRYLNHIPPSAAVNTSVNLAKDYQLNRLSGVVNGILRQYIRKSKESQDPLILPSNPIEKIAIQYSFPNWMIETWVKQWGEETTEKLCYWFNQTPTIDIRINPLKTTLQTLENQLIETGVNVTPLPPFPCTLRLQGKIGTIQTLPGFHEGHWTIQDSSAQLVSYLLDPQPGETIIDACAAPGGKTTHIAELMGDQGTVIACDRTPSRLKKVQQNAQRLQLNSIQTILGDSRHFTQFIDQGDRVLVDVPCSGLGTLHRHPDIRWRQTPEQIQELSRLQQEILTQAAQWVKPQGTLVYATCTLNPTENQQIIETFLTHHSHWTIEPPSVDWLFYPFVTSSKWIQILPHEHHTDGFFMVKLKKG
ncbi:16S rRNA (cytosine(967)-C(5))-methyltransferase [Crocosphaera chwakensis]|uniref:16S rRNA (cytosine(967)-C(5))-methyltransferase n=1 Tax=Crocosphaera chwakensis CCY0110 TaxID=391612 RepID=A3IK66_9CHRO|nr:16S rRNA (cytosine(967)-C(5))-methyltransferase [Crocosphaera chwakensis]EAZ93055.1 Fmu, rRNA SAM-dependent methyltransferase [Crocosphaera chwakensis CCY0110]